ncbi:lipopolysaccharide biosynthesis protein [Paenalcaligenes sp. Me131]|uniref:lipopolysaccharide biosynthesis protein n=1 Tax=Paenalcaligenes sp. Me131 TaxID=3392636 RepID=UPI003D272B67
MSLLVSGTAIGQLITVLSLPVLTRIYGPESFAILAVYVSALSLLTVIAGMCFEYAIPLPQSDRIAAALCSISVISVLLFTILSSVFVWVLPEAINSLTDHKIHDYLWLLPIGIFCIGIYNSLQYWSTRKRKIKLIAKTRVTQSIIGTTIKLGCGFLMNGWTAGLILGQLISQGSGFLSLGHSLYKNDWTIFKNLKFKHLRLAAKRYAKFPKLVTLESFSNTAGIQVPIILIAYYAAGPEVGYLMIAIQLLSIPMSLIGRSVSQVYLAEGSDRYHKGELEKFTKRTMLNLAKISAPPLLLLAIFSPFATPIILGNEWVKTGILITWMTPWFFMQFITSPVSTSLYITNNQLAALLLQIGGLVLRVGFVFIAVIYNKSLIPEFYAVSGFVFYLLYFFIVLKLLKN